MSVDVIEVRCWGDRVGAVAVDPLRRNTHVFEFDPKWMRAGVELSPLTMPVSQQVYSFPNLPVATFRGLPGLLADGLPDDFGNSLIDAWMAKRGIERSAISTLDRLAYMGKRGLGALEFRPASPAARDSKQMLEMRDLVEEARKAVSGDFADAHAKAALNNIIRVGTSAGGARAKAVIAWNPATNQVKSGQFNVPPGFEHWLLKFDGVGKDLELGTSGEYGRIEYAYHLMATAAGVQMSQCSLFEEGGRAHFMTKRFDRDGNTRHHVQTLCAMDHLDYKLRETHSYEQYFMVIAKLGLGGDERAQAFRRLVFNFFARNCDDHTKNFGFILRKGQSWALAPAYDVTHAYRKESEWVSRHLMSVGGKFENLTRDDLLAFADRFKVTDARGIISDVARAVGQWTEFAEQAGVSGSFIQHVQRDFQIT